MDVEEATFVFDFVFDFGGGGEKGVCPGRFPMMEWRFLSCSFVLAFDVVVVVVAFVMGFLRPPPAPPPPPLEEEEVANNLDRDIIIGLLQQQHWQPHGVDDTS